MMTLKEPFLRDSTKLGNQVKQDSRLSNLEDEMHLCILVCICSLINYIPCVFVISTEFK